jgi:hypothetical protein
LLVDEVLAVGDLEFQKKCLGKMQEVSKSGRTIVFVSHQMNQIRRLCERVLWFDGGQIRQQGPTGDVIAAYESAMLNAGKNGNNLPGDSLFLSWEIAGEGNILRDGLKPATLHFSVCPKETVYRGHFGMHIYNDSSVLVGSWGFDGLSLEAGPHQLSVALPYLPLRPGTYTIVCSMYTGGNNLTGGKLLEIWNAVPFLAVNTLPLSHPQDAWAGLFNIPANLNVEVPAENAQTENTLTETTRPEKAL